VVYQCSCYKVHPLNVAHFLVPIGILSQKVFEHLDIFLGFEGWMVRLRSVEISLDLLYVCHYVFRVIESSWYLEVLTVDGIQQSSRPATVRKALAA
jgi:hypothetical protein